MRKEEKAMSVYRYDCRLYSAEIGGDAVIRYTAAGQTEPIEISWPQFETDGVMSGIPSDFTEIGRTALSDVIEERVYQGSLASGAVLKMYLRLSPLTPFIRFSYELSSDKPVRLTKSGGENLTYFRYPGDPASRRTEVRLSGYNYLYHAYCPEEFPAFAYEDKIMGPILTERRGDFCMLTAYEHGSMYPNKFVAFTHDGGGIKLGAVKGNYYEGQDISQRPYRTIWLQAGAVRGGEDDIARVYREFQLKYCSLNTASRKPYIFYNTWAYQERNKFYNRQQYLSSMNQERIDEEIDIAHEMGVDVFVLDTGWYQKTGDWEVNLSRFPDGLRSVREKLERYGMKLGLWFGPTLAAKSSRILERNKNSVSRRRGHETNPFMVWETEESYPMCLVSDYWEDFADQLIRLSKEVGVTYFKWDAVDMYGCDCASHLHGTEGTSAEESRECFAFQVVQYMSCVVDKLCGAVPEAIVDFDVTEGGRAFGLAFLSSGKYFSINNGPYYQNYDIKIPQDQWSNIFVNPGPARSWICRQNLAYDRWIPSVLMMAHYIPDDPESSQMINIASLILGQNGIWGDLPAISGRGVGLFGKILSVYKTVRDNITEAYPIVTGKPGEVFEVHEKISSGKGVIVMFANSPGHYDYRISSEVSDVHTVFGSGRVTECGGEKRIEADFPEPGAVMAFFG